MTTEQHEAHPQVIELARLTAPCVVAEIDVAEGLRPIGADRGQGSPRCVWILVRMFTQLLGVVTMALPPGGLEPEQLLSGLMSVLGPELAQAAKNSGVEWPPEDPRAPFPLANMAPFLTSRRQVLAQAPPVMVVVCTRERPDSLRRCLASLMGQDYPEYSVLVVDSAPRTERSRWVANEMSTASVPIAYVVEPRSGLAWARNRALSMGTAQIIAWIDDDETADPFWLAELARGFSDYPSADAVSGIMLPAELETVAQIRFEQYGGFHKHRGFGATAFSPATAAQQSPLFPLPPFGTGGNMAFRRESLVAVGGFDTALGAGTYTHAGEDTRAVTELLLAGGTVVYQPSALTHHYHRRGHLDLKRQMFGYGAGLTAFYASLMLSRPRTIPQLARLLPTFAQTAFGPGSLRSGELPPDYPSDLRWANRQGLITGPIRYLAARAMARQLARRTGRGSR